MIPQKAGMTWMPKVESHMLVTLHGTVYGDPSMGVTARESYRSRMAALTAIFNLTATPFEIVLHPDAFGIGGVVNVGDTATITVEVLRVTGPPALGDQVRSLDLECRCISDPPAWVVSGS